MRDRGSAFAQSNLDLVLSYYRTGERSSEQIFVLVNGARPQGRPDIPGDELLAQILDRSRRSAGGERLAPCGFQIFLLADVADHGDHFTLIIFDQPGNND